MDESHHLVHLGTAMKRTTKFFHPEGIGSGGGSSDEKLQVRPLSVARVSARGRRRWEQDEAVNCKCQENSGSLNSFQCPAPKFLISFATFLRKGTKLTCKKVLDFHALLRWVLHLKSNKIHIMIMCHNCCIIKCATIATNMGLPREK